MDDEFEYQDLDLLKSTNDKDIFDELMDMFPERKAMISEGDSWFGYPRSNIFFGKNSNVIDYIEDKQRFNLLRLEGNGDEAVSMVSGKQKHEISKLLKRYKGKINVLLFSGGGNDIVGKWDMNFFLNEKSDGMTWQDCIKMDRLDRKVEQIGNAYLDLIAIRDDHCPDCTIITHGYDWPVPSMKGGRFLWGAIKTKAWMKPYMNKKKIKAQKEQNDIAKCMIKKLYSKLKEIEARPNVKRFIVTETPGTLNPNKDWLNEIHPTPDGFKKIADKVYAQIEGVLNK